MALIDCDKCGETHWHTKKCQKKLPPPELEKPTATLVAKDLVVNEKRQNLGFPRSGGQFGFQAGAPFSKSRTRFAQEIPAKT